ncbi:hypothetical protein [Streptomyces sp. NPDC003688]
MFPGPGCGIEGPARPDSGVGAGDMEKSAAEFAEHVGNSVEVLLGRYAKGAYGRQASADREVEELLREYE